MSVSFGTMWSQSKHKIIVTLFVVHDEIKQQASHKIQSLSYTYFCIARKYPQKGRMDEIECLCVAVKTEREHEEYNRA